MSSWPLPLPLPHGCGPDFGAAGRQAVAEAEWDGERAARQGVAAGADEINAAGGAGRGPAEGVRAEPGRFTVAGLARPPRQVTCRGPVAWRWWQQQQKQGQGGVLVKRW